VVLVASAASVAVALNAGMTGMRIDESYCRRHDIETTSFIFERCTFYTAAATPIGWFGGSVAGATLGATITARRRGCATRDAFWRSLGGAVAGALPGALVVANHPRVYTPPRSMLVALAPLYSGAGAALAVLGCRSR
jgi:hypothetical protein